MNRSSLLFLILISTIGPACAAEITRTYRDPGERVRAFANEVDWNKATAEATEILSAYIKVDTQNPPGNETIGARYLAAILEKEGIASEIVELAPGRGSLIARLDGRDKTRPLCLLSHIDVVPGDAKEWEPGKGPLSGTIADGVIWGRGALDMKGMGVVELMTVLLLHRRGVPLTRDVILIAVADEEVANQGMRQLTEPEHWKKLGCAEMINEGGIGVKGLFFPDQTVYPISFAEKGVLWLKVSAKGKPGHGSTPLPDTAPMRLLSALDRLRRREPRPEVHPAFFELLASAGEQHGGISGFILRRPFLARMFAVGKLMEIPPAKAAITDTVNITGLRSPANEPNVVPSEASAIIDSRLLPGHGPDRVLRELKSMLGERPGISFEVVRTFEGNESPLDDPLYQAILHHATRGRDGVVAGPVVSPGFTDSIFARRLGTHAYGFVPFEITAEELATMHGTNERVSIENLGRGVRMMFEVVLDVAAEPAAEPVPRAERITPAR